MSASSSSPDVPTGPSQLNGWKDIAAYLGRSVRTVQRWEKDFGLPVRRFGQSRPESVFAITREIDVWLLTSQGVNARSGSGAQEPAGGPAALSDTLVSTRGASLDGQPEPLFPRRWFVRMALAAVAEVVVLLLLWAAWAYRQPGQGAMRPAATSPGGEPAEWQVDLDTLVVSDANGNVLWKHPFPGEMQADHYKGAAWTPRSVLGGIADVDGDGHREVWFIAKPAGGPADNALYLFDRDGRVRWTYKPTRFVRFGTETFGPSWLVDRAFITPDPAGATERAIWVVLYDSALFPSSIQRLDPGTGSLLGEYWTNGSIVTAALDASASPPRLLVGACYNETKAGSLSVLDALNLDGAAPAESDKYRCTSCPPGEPLAFLVFPKPARFGKADSTGPVETLTPQKDGTLGVRVRYAWSDPDSSAVGVFRFDSSLAPISADSADDYLAVYNQLVARGDAPAGAPATVDPLREFFPILRWDGAARRYQKVFPPR